MIKTAVAALLLSTLFAATTVAQDFSAKFDVFGGSHDGGAADPSLVVFSTAWDRLVSEKHGKPYEYEDENYEALLSADHDETKAIVHKALESDILRDLYSAPERKATFEEIYKYGVQTNSPVAAVPIGDAFDLYMAGKTINSGGGIPITADDEDMFHDPNRALCIWLISCGWPKQK